MQRNAGEQRPCLYECILTRQAMDKAQLSAATAGEQQPVPASAGRGRPSRQEARQHPAWQERRWRPKRAVPAVGQPSHQPWRQAGAPAAARDSKGGLTWRGLGSANAWEARPEKPALSDRRTNSISLLCARLIQPGPAHAAEPVSNLPLYLDVASKDTWRDSEAHTGALGVDQLTLSKPGVPRMRETWRKGGR